jgi:hypothetical protein
MLIQQTVLLPEMSLIYEYLYTNIIPYVKSDFCDIYSKQIAISHVHDVSNQYSIRIWKTNVLCSTWYNDAYSSLSQFIAALDYTIDEDHIKIEFLSVNDEEYQYFLTNDVPALNIIDSILLKQHLIEYVKSVAKEKKKPFVFVDIHHNLYRFNKDYARSGFKVTKRKCTKNKYWLEAECKVV